MRAVGFLLLLAGWFLVLASVVLLGGPASRAVFVFAGLAVEVLGLVFFFRSHSIPRGKKG